MRLHRWGYDTVMQLHCCVDADIGGVDSGQWCWPGCGTTVTDLELHCSGLPCERRLINISLDALARQKGRRK